ncbi:unnamed protein product, partial [Rotaria sordida]
MVVHRRCQSKVGNYCGYQGNPLELYQIWKAKHKSNRDYNYQYNGDLCEIYSKVYRSDRPNHIKKEVIRRRSRINQSNTTSAFNINEIQFLQQLGFGMTGK